MPGRMKTSGNAVTQTSNGFIQSVRINRMMSPSDADDLGRPCNSLFELQVVHRYVFIVVKFCLKSCNLNLHMVYA